MKEECLICISGLSSSITEAKIRDRILNPLGFCTTEFYLDKRCDGSSYRNHDMFTKCFLNIDTEMPIKKVCSTIFKATFDDNANIQVKPIALIPVDVKAEYAKTGSNVVEEPKTSRVEFSSSNCYEKRPNEYDNHSFSLSGKNEASEQDNEGLICLTGLGPESTEQSVIELLEGTNTDVKKVHLFSSPSENGDEQKLKVYINVAVFAGLGVKRFCAFLSRELTAKSGSKISVKSVDSLPASYLYGNKHTGRGQYDFKEHRKRNYNEENANGSGHSESKSWKLDYSENSKYNDEKTVSQTSAPEIPENFHFFCLTGLPSDSTEQSVTDLLEDTKTVVRKVQLDSSLSENGETKLKVYIDVELSSGFGAKRFCAFLSKELTAKVGSKVAIKLLESWPRVSKKVENDHYGNSSSRYESERYPTDTHKLSDYQERNNQYWERSDHHENSQYKYEKRRRFDDDNIDNDNSHNENDKYRRSYDYRYPEQPAHIPIIYYDPKNPSHKCYELGYEDSKAPPDATTSTDNAKLKKVEDNNRTQALKQVLKSNAASGFSFGFSADDVATNESTFVNVADTDDPLPAVEEEAEKTEQQKAPSIEVEEVQSGPTMKSQPQSTNIGFTSLFSVPEISELSSGFFRHESEIAKKKKKPREDKIIIPSRKPNKSNNRAPRKFQAGNGKRPYKKS